MEGRDAGSSASRGKRRGLGVGPSTPPFYVGTERSPVLTFAGLRGTWRRPCPDLYGGSHPHSAKRLYTPAPQVSRGFEVLFSGDICSHPARRKVPYVRAPLRLAHGRLQDSRPFDKLKTGAAFSARTGGVVRSCRLFCAEELPWSTFHYGQGQVTLIGWRIKQTCGGWPTP